MSQEGVQALVERYLNDGAFRAAMRTDPAAILAATGLDLSEEEQAALRKSNWSLSDEELEERISKGTFSNMPCGA